jgi:glycosyltransferase involved in cell wall biosynthesis
MRILLVCPAVPQPPSHGTSRLVASPLLDHLGERHAFALVAAAGPGDSGTARTWLASAAAPVEIVSAHRMRHLLSGRPAEGLRVLAAALRRASAAFRPDVVHLESALLAPLARVAGVPCVLVCHESPVTRARGAGRYPAPTWQRLRARLDERHETAWARQWLGGVTACVVECEDDRRISSAHVPLEQIEVIPSGIDAERYACRRVGHASRLVFTGDVSSPGDLDAAHRLATSILPMVRRRIPRAELLIAATGDAEAAHDLARLEGVRVESRLADLRPSLWGAGIYVSPLAAGGGRASRLLEAFALGTPVVASAASLSRLDDVVPGQHVLVAEDDTDFADAVGLLMREPVMAATLAHNARGLVERCRTWYTIAQRYDDLYQRLGQPPMERAA